MTMRPHFNWKLTVLVVLCLPLLVRLGFWQLERAEEKREILQAQETMMYQPAMNYSDLEPQQFENYRQVSLRARLLPHIFLLDNQMYQSRFGYEVIQAAELAEGDIVWVSRGWIQGSLDRSELPEIDSPQESLRLEGYLYQPTQGLELAQTKIGEDWPRVIQTVDLEKMYKAIGKTGKITPLYLLRLDAQSPMVLNRHWQVINIQPEKHTGYAIQWFGMAILLVVLYLWASFRQT